jgi:hypothetical protein
LREETLGFKDGLPYRPPGALPMREMNSRIQRHLVFDVYSCVVIAVKATPTIDAVMPTNMQLFGYFLTAIGAIL